MTAHAHDTITPATPARKARRADAEASGCPSATSTGSSWPGALRRPARPARRRVMEAAPRDRVGVAEADRVPVAAPQGLQADLVAAAGRRRGRGLAGHRRGRRRVHSRRGCAAGPRSGCTGPRPGRCRSPPPGWSPWRSGCPAAWPPAGPRPDVGGRLGPPDHRAPGGLFAAAGPGRAPGRAGAGRAGVGVAELRHHRRARRHHGLGADHLRRPPVEAPGPHRPGPDPRARRRPAAGPRRTRSRSAAPSAPSATPGTPCSPSTPAHAPGTWSSSARPAAGRRT